MREYTERMRRKEGRKGDNEIKNRKMMREWGMKMMMIRDEYEKESEEDVMRPSR